MSRQLVSAAEYVSDSAATDALVADHTATHHSHNTLQHDVDKHQVVCVPMVRWIKCWLLQHSSVTAVDFYVPS